MSRIARTPSSTGIYHAILRGINKQQIFECHQDYLYFEDILRIVCGLDPLEKRPRRHARRRKGAYVNDEQLSSLYLPQAETEEEEDEAKNVRHCYIYAYCMMGNHVHLLIKGAKESAGTCPR